MKPRLLGHWGTTPGLNFIYVHLNRIIKQYDLNMIYVTGPGHGGPGLVANTYLEGTYSEMYPEVSRDERGMRNLFTQFSFPGGIPSHVAAETPGSINEGGELGTGVDDGFGLVHTVRATSANVADVNVFGELLHGGEERVHGDSAYHSKELKARAEACGLEFNVNERGTKHYPLSATQKARNRRFSRVRAIGEHPYLVVKQLWGHARVRYRGIAKNLAQMTVLFALANLYRVRHRLLAAT